MVSLLEFQTAQHRIREYVRQTPTTFDPRFKLHFKWENHQETHSFKIRGAFNKIFAMKSIPSLLVTGSAGNHGQAVALVAKKASVQAWVFVPENTPKVKVNRMLELGAKVEFVPGLFGDAEAKAIETARELGIPFISPYNDQDVIAGAGTIALEWLEQLPSLGRILVPVGGGGLISGVGLAAKALNPEIEIIGVLSEASAYLFHHYYYGHMQNVVELPTLTDGLAGAVEPGSITLAIIHQACDGIIQVNEKEVASAVAYLYRECGETVEGSGAVGLAAVMSGKIDSRDLPTGAIISGGNIDADKLESVLRDSKIGK